ncbi:MAG: hypothetical protein BAJALOKI3v1_1380001 [Promethearchaeota archaeon]|nr:MAG: hypothetical protein BAJALOKI3v1_1380001 [Candidatus Lokiarchaeota archaeon]
MKLHKIHFTEKESDITIISESKDAIRRAQRELSYQRTVLEKYTSKNSKFLTTFKPLRVKTDLEIIDLMSKASYICGVGPMATVAGALADLMLRVMEREDKNYFPSKNNLVENGGEIIIDSRVPFKIGLFAGENPLNFNLGFLINKEDCPIGIGTSSATIGHATSLGEADAVTIFAKNATIADGAATRVANEVKGDNIEKSIKKGLDIVDDLNGVKGAFISRKNKVGQKGYIPKIVKIDYKNLKVSRQTLTEILPGDTEFFK